MLGEQAVPSSSGFNRHRSNDGLRIFGLITAFVATIVWESRTGLWDYGTAITVPLLALAASWLSLRNATLIAVGLIFVPASVSWFESIPIPLGTLLYRTVVYITVIILVARLHYWQSRYRHELHIDPLTGCLTRDAFLSQLQIELHRSTRSGRSFALLFLDCDRFKDVNDRWGHRRGDEVLKTLADCLRGQLRPYDRIGRYGGDEFLVLIPGIGSADVPSTAERLRSAIELSMQHEQVPTTCSIGVVLVSRFEVAAEQLVERADSLMYEVKQRDGNGVACDCWPESDPASTTS